VRLLSARPANAAQEIFTCASREAAELSFALGCEHLLLATAILGATLGDYDVSPDDIRERILAGERDALASLGISLDSVRGELEERLGHDVWSQPCGLPVTPEAKRVLELATRRRRVVSPDQMLAALIRHSPRMRRLLFELGVPVGTLAERLRR
jgi:ClpA/ClpB-like protein